jgi:hypothetical protein
MATEVTETEDPSAALEAATKLVREAQEKRTKACDAEIRAALERHAMDLVPAIVLDPEAGMQASIRLRPREERPR